MEIIGSRKFVRKTKIALSIIKNHFPDEYYYIEQRFERIVEHSTLFLYSYSPITYFVSKRIYESDPVLYASYIMKALANYYYICVSRDRNDKGDYNLFDGSEYIDKLHNYQISNLRQMDATSDLINQVNLEHNKTVNEFSNKIRIIGPKDFINKVKSALLLLKEKDYLSYLTVIRNIKQIIYFHDNSFTIADPYHDRQTCLLNFNGVLTKDVSVANVACVLLHEATHFVLYEEAFYENKDPYRTYLGYPGEMICLTRQIECLKKICDDEDLLQLYIAYYDTNWWEEDKEENTIKRKK